jgi:hypothetical protein
MARAAQQPFIEGAIVQRGDNTVRVQMRLCRDDLVIAAFKKDYPAARATTEQIIDDLATEFERQEPGAAKLLRERPVTMRLRLG